MAMSWEIKASHLEGEIKEINNHIVFLRGQMEIVWEQCLIIDKPDKDKNLIKISAKIAGLRSEKDRIKKKIKELRA